MSKILYCPWCDKYVEEPSYHCTFCGSQTIYIKAWNNKSLEEKEEWLKKFPKVEPPRATSSEWILRNAERFDKETKAAIAQEAELAKYVPKCPVCGCPHLDKIGAGSKLIDVAVWGFASKKPGKQFKCKACGYEF